MSESARSGGKRKRGKQASDQHIAAVVRRVVDRTREHKYFLDTLNNAPINNTNTLLNCLSRVPVGDAEGERDGRQIKPTSLEITFSIAADPSTLVGARLIEPFRVIVLLWKVDDNADPPSAADFLENATTGFTCTLSSYKQRPTAGFSILYDKLVPISSVASPVSALMKVTLRSLPMISFNGASATTGKNHLYVFASCGNANVLPNGTSFGYISTLRYTDS